MLNHGNGEFHILNIPNMEEGVPAELEQPFGYGGALKHEDLSAAMRNFCIERGEPALEKQLALKRVGGDVEGAFSSESIRKSL
jgi:hypothetical protein